MNVIDGQAGQIICASLIFYSLTIDNILNIIILLILAGIAIMQLTGSGLFEKSKEAKEKWENAQENEETEIAKYTNEIDNYVEGNRYLDESVKISGNDIKTPSSTNTWQKVADFPSGYTYTNCYVDAIQWSDEDGAVESLLLAIAYSLRSDGIYLNIKDSTRCSKPLEIYLQKK